MIKVIHFIAGIDKAEGGTTEYMRLLSSELKNQLELVVATRFSPNPVLMSGARTKFFNTNILRWFALVNEFSLFLKYEKPDIVHINGIWSPQNFGFQKAAEKLGIKVILSPHGMLEPWILAQNPWKKKFGLFLYQKKAIQNATYIHATAEMESSNIKILGFNNQICIIPNGIDLSNVKKIKTYYGTKKMIFLSRIHPKKGIELLLKAWQNSNTDGWILEIAGNGDKDYIENLSQSAKNLKNVTFVGPKYDEDKWDFLRSADVLILPTYSENFGIVVAEALAVGVPVITTQGTPWEDLEIHECGWWIDLSVTTIENTLSKVFNLQISSLERMGFNGKKLVKEKYNIKVIGKKMVEIYNIILQR